MRLIGKYGTLKMVVLGLYFASATGFTTNTATAPIMLSETYLFILGLGYGGILTVMLLALLSAVGNKDQAVTTAILFLFRTTGATLGVTLSSSTVFRNVLVSSLHGSHTSEPSPQDPYKSAGFDGLDQTLREMRSSTTTGRTEWPMPATISPGLHLCAACNVPARARFCNCRLCEWGSHKEQSSEQKSTSSGR